MIRAKNFIPRIYTNSLKYNKRCGQELLTLKTRPLIQISGNQNNQYNQRSIYQRVAIQSTACIEVNPSLVRQIYESFCNSKPAGYIRDRYG